MLPPPHPPTDVRFDKSVGKPMILEDFPIFFPSLSLTHVAWPHSPLVSVSSPKGNDLELLDKTSVRKNGLSCLVC